MVRVRFVHKHATMKRRLPNTAIAMVTTYNAIHPGWLSSANRYPETTPESGIRFTYNHSKQMLEHDRISLICEVF